MYLDPKIGETFAATHVPCGSVVGRQCGSTASTKTGKLQRGEELAEG